eukprot:GFUD01003503.1.p1 GENE.GFUD01003503.1~~GFUD01003503.1.p1  ORF type:complete len:422 (+),score=133.37 GFUD01003503.1:61-1266(+)
MAPREPDSFGYSTVTRAFKVTDKALTHPVVSDAVSEVSKFTAPIAPYLEEGMGTITEESLSDSEVEYEVESCVTNLDSLACNGLDQLTYTLPTWRSATPDLVETTEETASYYEGLSEEYLALVETTKETANNYGGLLQEYLASFKIIQLGIRLADSGLAILESPLSLVSASSKVQHVRRHLRVVRRAGEKRGGHPSKKGSVLLQVLDMFQLNYLLGVLGMQLVEEPLTSIPTKKRKVIDDEDSEMDPDFVPSIVESQDSLEYRSDSETEIELEVSQEVDSDVEELEDCPNTVWTSLACLVGEVTEEDSEVDPDFVPSTEESQDSLEYRSESELELEESEEVDSEVEELEDCPTTPNCVKVEHKIGKISEQTEAGGHVEEELDEEYERFRELKLKNLKDFGS